jgi:hypothetical protein
MLFILLFITVWSASLAGWGGGVLKFSGPRGSWKTLTATEYWALAVLLGHLPVLLFGYTTHLWLPLGGGLIGLFILGGIPLLRRAQLPSLSHPALLGVILLLTIVSVFASRPIAHGDSAGYHLQAVMWMAQEPVVRGLVNLHSTFGYNSSWWILSALMSWPFGEALGAVVVSGPLLTAVGCLIFAAMRRLWCGAASPSDWFWVPAFYLWLRQLAGANTPSPSNDIPANLLVLAGVWIIVRAAPVQGWRLIAGPEGFVFLCLALIAATAKLSAAPLLLFGLTWLIIFLMIEVFAQRRIPRDVKVSGFLLPLLFGFSFLWHGWLLSGYPLFPSSISPCWEAPWKAPADLPAQNFDRARQWAFTFGADSAELSSQPAWKIWLMGQHGATNMVIALACAAALLGAAFFVLLRPAARLRLRSYLPPALCSALGMSWNLASAPALRFASGFAFALFGSVAAAVGPALPPRWTRFVLAAWCVVSLAALVQLATGRQVSWIHPAPTPQGDEGTIASTREGYAIHLAPRWDSWFAPKPSIPAFEFNPDLKTIRDPKTGRIIEFRF